MRCEWFDAEKLTGIRGEKRQQGWHATANRAREKKQQREFKFERGRVGLHTKAREREREREREIGRLNPPVSARPHGLSTLIESFKYDDHLGISRQSCQTA